MAKEDTVISKTGFKSAKRENLPSSFAGRRLDARQSGNCASRHMEMYRTQINCDALPSGMHN